MVKFKKLATIFLRVSISIALLIFIFRKVDEKEMLVFIKNADKLTLLLAFLIFFSNYFLSLIRWEMLLKAVKIYLPFKRVIMSFAGGVFFNVFLPSTIGGDFVRSMDLASHTKKPKEVIATVLLDRLSGYAGLVLVSLIALLLGYKSIQDKSVFISVGLIAGLLVVVLFLLFNKFTFSKLNKLLNSPNAGKIREAIKGLHQEVHYFRHHKEVIVHNLILSVIIQIITPLCFYFIGLSLGIKLNIIYYFIFLPIIGAITLLPISIGGLGLRDMTVIYFFTKAGVDKDLAFAMSILSFSFIVIYGIIGGVIYVFTLHHRRIQYHKSPMVSPRG